MITGDFIVNINPEILILAVRPLNVLPLEKEFPSTIVSWTNEDKIDMESIITEPRQKTKKIFTISSPCFFTIRNIEISEKKNVK